MSKIAIIQSNYIPWKGYFDIIDEADKFVIYDSVQFTKGDWRNRNFLKSANGKQLITIPVKHNSLKQSISETLIQDNLWTEKHYKTICNLYSKSKFFNEHIKYFEDLYCQAKELIYLTDINHLFIQKICNLLNIKTEIIVIRKNEVALEKNEQIIFICKKFNCDYYISGPSGANYLNETIFKKNNIRINFKNYSNYPVYTQLYKSFFHDVSIIDLIFNEGCNDKKKFKSKC